MFERVLVLFDKSGILDILCMNEKVIYSIKRNTGYAPHEKAIRKQQGIVPLVGSKERRALFVLAINWWYTPWATLGCIFPSIYIGTCLFVTLGEIQRKFFRCFLGCQEGLFSRRTVLFANSPARLRPAIQSCTLKQPACGTSGIWTRQIIAFPVSPNPEWSWTCNSASWCGFPRSCRRYSELRESSS